jgi:hypothetical protein
MNWQVDSSGQVEVVTEVWFQTGLVGCKDWSFLSLLPSELIPVSCLHERHDGVGDGCPDVGPHDDGDSSPHGQHWRVERTR